MEEDCPHFYQRDDHWKRRMRFHQSWYRRHRLKLEPGEFGNRLRSDWGDAGRNFLTEDIHRVALDRLALDKGAVKKDRLLCDMLSSQPMCFNLFGPLRLEPKLATHLLQALLPARSASAVATRTEIEYPLSNPLTDRTAFDAFIEYRLEDGRIGFVGVEVKLTEKFSDPPTPYTERYARWVNLSKAWWHATTPIDFENALYNQLWRDHLLAFAMLRNEPTTYDECYCAVAFHDCDEVCPIAISDYRKKLTAAGNDTLIEWKLSDVVNALSTSPVTSKDWVDAFRDRYLNIELSDIAFEEHWPIRCQRTQV
jgi:hypothetical protein